MFRIANRKISRWDLEFVARLHIIVTLACQLHLNPHKLMIKSNTLFSFIVQNPL
jgi:hypothetical protein